MVVYRCGEAAEAAVACDILNRPSDISRSPDGDSTRGFRFASHTRGLSNSPHRARSPCAERLCAPVCPRSSFGSVRGVRAPPAPSPCQVGQGQQEVSRLRVPDVRVGTGRSPSAVPILPGGVDIDDSRSEVGALIVVVDFTEPDRGDLIGWGFRAGVSDARCPLGDAMPSAGRPIRGGMCKDERAVDRGAVEQPREPFSKDVSRSRHLEDEQGVHGIGIPCVRVPPSESRWARLRCRLDSLDQQPSTEGVADTMQVLPAGGAQGRGSSWTNAVRVEIPQQVGQGRCGMSPDCHVVRPVPDAAITAQNRCTRGRPTDDDGEPRPHWIDIQVTVRGSLEHVGQRVGQTMSRSRRPLRRIPPAVREDYDVGDIVGHIEPRIEVLTDVSGRYWLSGTGIDEIAVHIEVENDMSGVVAASGSRSGTHRSPSKERCTSIPRYIEITRPSGFRKVSANSLVRSRTISPSFLSG